MTTFLTKKYNLSYMDQLNYLDGYHRSGWPFVMRQLYKLHASDADVKLDCYVDRTFHWLKPTFLPYSAPWVGIIHHTFNEKFSTFNNITLLKSESFIASLASCKGLYVFSNNMATRWRTELNACGINVPVESLFHPTEFVSAVWTPDAFNANNAKKIVQIGAWLRDNYSMYHLNGTKRTIDIGQGVVLRKAALKGPVMDHYFKPTDFFKVLRPPSWKIEDSHIPPLMSSANTRIIYGNGITGSGEIVEDVSPNATINITIVEEPSETDDTICRDNVCRDIVCRDSNMFLNKYVKGAIELLQAHDDSVAIIPTISNDDYDTLLSQNIVYLKLWDAAAVNTIIECIVRNTPVLVNRLPATEEVLGVDYPLFMPTDDVDDIPRWLTITRIMDAFVYLRSMDKTYLESEYFLQMITNGGIYSSL